jgi:hypothetical protein
LPSVSNHNYTVAGRQAIPITVGSGQSPGEITISWSRQ